MTGWVPQVKWTQATSNRLMLEAGISYYNQAYEQNCRPTVGPNDLPRLEQTTGRLTVAAGNTIPPYTSWTKDYSSMASVSYVTGSHAIKTGMTMLWGTNSRDLLVERPDQHAGVQQRRPIAVAVTQRAEPRPSRRSSSDLGLFVQDTWTMDRLTLNLGARFDHFNAEVPAQSAPAGPWIGARNFAGSRTCPTGTTGRCAPPAPTTCSAPARRR